MTINTLLAWHDTVSNRNLAGLNAILADEVVFHSPVKMAAMLQARGTP